MQDSPTTLILVAILLLALQTAATAYVLMRNAKKIANWDIRLRKAMLGQFAVLVVASVVAGAFVASTKVVPILSTFETVLATPFLFLLACGIGQARLITYLATSQHGRRFIETWNLKRICYATALHVLFVYVCLGVLVLSAMYFLK